MWDLFGIRSLELPWILDIGSWSFHLSHPLKRIHDSQSFGHSDVGPSFGSMPEPWVDVEMGEIRAIVRFLVAGAPPSKSKAHAKPRAHTNPLILFNSCPGHWPTERTLCD